jgi:predicted ATPase
LGEYAVKGKSDTIKSYRVIAPSALRTRFDVSAERGLTPFVGRERELELLLDGFQRSKAGRGQAVSIVSEAGVGKSRLLYEFRKAVANEDVIFQEGKCLSYSRGVAYHPVTEVVKANFDIRESDGDFDIREKLTRGLKVLDADEISTLPYLLELLSVKDSGVDPIALSPEARKDRIIKATIRITIKASQIRPLIIAIEDLHWIDNSSEDYLKELLDSISGAQVFLIFTYRPEFVHTWGAKSYHSQVNLNRLSNRESLAVVTHLLGTENIANDLEELILEKAEGVPFFIEEFIKSLKELNTIEKKDGIYHLANHIQAVSIPSTIQDVIMARVDKLPEGAKGLIQTGSAIEREFSYELIKSVSGLPEQELLPQLSALKDSELIFERGIYPESIYVFKHALTQEVVYDSILAKRKKELHNKIGQSIEQVYKDNLHDHYGVLAEHFVIAKNYKKGAAYCRLAAKKAEKAVALNDAIAYGEKQVICLERLPRSKELEKNIIDAKTVLGLFFAQMSHWGRAKAIFDSIVKLAEDTDYKRRIAHIYCILGFCSGFQNEDVTNGLQYLKKALKIGLELSDPLALVLSNNLMGNILCLTGDFDKAHYYLKKGLEINVAANAQWGIATTKCWIALNYYYQGNIDFAHQVSLEALRIADESGDVYSRAHAYTLQGFSFYGKGKLEEAKEYVLKGVDLSEKINHYVLIFMANSILADIYFAMREYEASQKHCQRAIPIFRDNSLNPSAIKSLKLALLRANLMKDTDINFESMYTICNEVNFQVHKSEAQMYISEILINIDDQNISEAEGWIKKGIESHRKCGMRWYLAKDYVLYAELFKRKGDLPKAQKNLTKAMGIFKECGADGWVEKYEKELAELS